MDNSNYRTCSACKHCRREWVDFGGYDFAKCYAPSNMVVDRISGKLSPVLSFCSIQRSPGDSSTCGVSGKWFEPKDPTFFTELWKMIRPFLFRE